jgi:hypothetical protein
MDNRLSVDEKNTKVDFWLKIAKIAALFVPAVLSGVLICVTIVKLGNNAYCLDSLEFKLNAGLSIIGIAVTVWVGLNIYNVVERTQIDKLIKDYNELKVQNENLGNSYHDLQQTQEGLLGSMKALHQAISLDKEIYLTGNSLNLIIESGEYKLFIPITIRYLGAVKSFLESNYSTEQRLPVPWLSQFKPYINGVKYYCSEYLAHIVNADELKRNIKSLESIVERYTKIFKAPYTENYFKFDTMESDIDIMEDYINEVQKNINKDPVFGLLYEALDDQKNSIDSLRQYPRNTEDRN